MLHQGVLLQQNGCEWKINNDWHYISVEIRHTQQEKGTIELGLKCNIFDIIFWDLKWCST